MEFFGISLYGYPDFIKELMRPDYKEPEDLAEPLPDHMQGGHKPTYSELLTKLDCYLGHCNGYAYKSYDRLIKMRNKGIFKPVGPSDMYKYPGTRAMEFGFFLADPALCCETWHLRESDNYCPQSDVHKFFKDALKIDKLFRL